MIGPDRLDRVSAGAVVPEQVISYVRSVAGSRPRLFGACVGYETEGQLVLIGYPLHDPVDSNAMSHAVDQALKIPGLQKITVISPTRPPQAPGKIRSGRDDYFVLPVPAPPPAAKLRNLLRRADRELTIEHGRQLEHDHQALVDRFLSQRTLAAGTRRIFRQIPRYLQASPGSMLVSARTAGGRLAAFAVGEYASLHTALFMFCFRDPSLAPPGSSDRVFSGLMDEAARRGHTRMNLGLGVNAGIRFFKRKWGAQPFLPCIQTEWEIKPADPVSRL
ncbi:MAG: GNAT family N-acetyltransferase [Desulfobacterales bacterium]|nr:GNAT family N-acetyltransferase [Desulfobacterales bacterium]